MSNIGRLRRLLIFALVTHWSYAAPPVRRSDLIWEGESNGFLIRWTRSDILVKPAAGHGDAVFSARTRAMKLGPKKPRRGEPWPYMEYFRSYKMLSLVGPIVTLEENEDYSNPGEYSTVKFVVVNLSAPNKRIKLTDLFPDAEIYKALLADPIVKESLAKIDKPRQMPRTCAGLFRLLGNRAQFHSGESRYGFDEDMLGDFAFHHIEGDRVAVRLAIFFEAGMRWDDVAQLGLLLPIPESLREPLSLADARKQGFLMQDSRDISHGREARIDYVPKQPR